MATNHKQLNSIISQLHFKTHFFIASNCSILDSVHY